MSGQVIPAIAVILAGAILARLVVWSIWRAYSPRRSITEQPVVFFLLVCFALFAMRLPQICWRHEFNPDESQMLAQALRFVSHPIPWRDVDTTTGGPLNSLLLSVPIFFGAPASWQLARVMLLLLISLTLVFIYLAMRCFMVRQEAEFALMPTILFFAFTLHYDFNHYSSEMLSVMLLSAGMYLLAREWFKPKSSKLGWFLLGWAMGSIPFAKLQATPLALFLVFVGMIQIFITSRIQPAKSFLPNFICLCLGGLCTPGIIIGVVAACGAFGDFWKSYVLSGSAFTAQESMITKYENLDSVLTATTDFRLYLLAAAGVALISLLPIPGSKTPQTRRFSYPLIVVLATLLLAWLCLLIAGKNHYHYALLLVPPLAILFGLCFYIGKSMRKAADAEPCRAYKIWLAAFAVMAIGFQLYKVPIYIYSYDKYVRHGHILEATPSPVSLLIEQASRPHDTMSIWGWMPAYYVETGIMPATRDALCHYMIDPGPQREYYRNRYLSDLEKAHPALFVDAIADNTFLWPGAHDMTHECFLSLSNFVATNYTLWRTVRLTNDQLIGTPVRIYLANQRMAELHSAPAKLDAPSSNPSPPP